MNSFIALLRGVQRLRPWRVAGSCAAIALGAFASAAVIAATASEHKLKSAFLYNFTKFVEWPAQRFSTDTSPLVIALMADQDMLLEMTNVVANRSVNGRALHIRRVTKADDLHGIHILFVSSTENARYMSIRQGEDLEGVLTVGEDKECTLRGSSICFTYQGEKLRFEINVDTAARAQLKISAQLQKLAIAVHRG